MGAPRPLLTGAVHLSHFDYKTFKVLRSSKYSLLTLRSREQKPKIFLTFLLFFGGGGGGGEVMGITSQDSEHLYSDVKSVQFL